MIGALFYLLWNSWKNRLKMRVRRLKQPKYLVGAIFGVLYFMYVFGFRFILGAAYSGSRGKAAGAMITPENALYFESVGAMILLGLVLLAWVIPYERAALVFSEAEVAFLFPAPVSRRTLIHYKLLKSQVAILFMIFFLTIFFGRFWAGGMAWVRAFGWWVILSTLNLHILASSFMRTILLEHGISNWKRRALVLGLVGAGVAGVWMWAKQTIPAPDVDNIKGITDVQYYFQEVIKAGPVPYLLYPFRIVVRPYVEGWSGSVWLFLQALWPALLLMAAHYWWVMRSDVAFEEASVEASKKMAERVASIRANRGHWPSKPKKKKRPPFKLNPVGAAAVGFLWKNLIGAGSIFTWRFWVLMACVMMPVGTALATAHSTQSAAMALGPMGLFVLGFSFLFGPQVMRQDFRNDLPMADVLKTYPMKGWQVALGEVLAPAVILTAFQWVLLILSMSLISSWGTKIFPLGTWLAMAIGVALIAPGLNLVSLLIPNAAVLLFPGWLQSGKEGPQGIEATGQRLVFALGQAVVLAVSLVPASLVFAVIYFVGRLAVGPVMPVPFAAAGAAGVLLTEGWFGLLWLGKLFQRFDVAGDA